MSQKAFLIALSVAVVLMTVEAEAKRIGCASFGHSCYGGHGKRSDPAVVVAEVEANEQPPIPMMRMLQRRFSYAPETPQNEVVEREKEVRLIILNLLQDVISDALKKPLASDQEGLA